MGHVGLAPRSAGQRVGAALVLANDPDADRLAAAERQLDGSYRAFSGNEIGLLLAHWVWERWRQAHPEVGQGGGGRQDGCHCPGRAVTASSCCDCLIVSSCVAAPS